MSLDGNKDYDHLLIIDSEGFQSSLNSDKEFERKMACFILSVSHIVLINVKGEIHSPM
jgi:hypothetical protein